MRVVQRTGQVQISPVLDTAAGKCHLPNLRLQIVHDEDSVVLPGAECAGEIVAGNPFLLRAEFNANKFLAENLERLS